MKLSGTSKVPLNKQANGLEVAKAGHKSEGCIGMIADRHDSERLRGFGD